MTEKTKMPASQDAQEILEKRARILARRPAESVIENDVLKLISFPLGHERYGVDITLIQEVQPLKQQNWSCVPCTPDFISGVVNIRGRIYSLMDIGRFLGLPTRPKSEQEQVLLVRSKNQEETVELGILADNVPEVVTVFMSDMQAAPTTLSDKAREFVRGVTKEMLIILDLKRLLSDPRIIVDEKE